MKTAPAEEVHLLPCPLLGSGAGQGAEALRRQLAQGAQSPGTRPRPSAGTLREAMGAGGWVLLHPVFTVRSFGPRAGWWRTWSSTRVTARRHPGANPQSPPQYTECGQGSCWSSAARGSRTLHPSSSLGKGNSETLGFNELLDKGGFVQELHRHLAHPTASKALTPGPRTPVTHPVSAHTRHHH